MKNKTKLILFISIIIFIEILFIGFLNIRNIKEIFELQKIYIEIIFLLISLLSGKLLLEAISYIKESKIKNFKEISNLIFEYENKIDDILLNLTKLDLINPGISLESSVGIGKIIILILSLEDIIGLSLDSNNKNLFENQINSIYIKIFFKLSLNTDSIEGVNYLKKNNDSKFTFHKVIQNRLNIQIDKKLTETFLNKINLLRLGN